MMYWDYHHRPHRPTLIAQHALLRRGHRQLLPLQIQSRMRTGETCDFALILEMLATALSTGGTQKEEHGTE
jgi:hypothetical protein